MKLHFVLGASDPEMVRIERLLDSVADTGLISYSCACTPDTMDRVLPGNAYRSPVTTGVPAGWVREGGQGLVQAHKVPVTAEVPAGATVVAVECGYPADVMIDHHRPGDPGYGQPPERYLEASSIGQVVRMLTDRGLVTTEAVERAVPDWRLAAAADHCLHAAYRARCPGVDPDALMEWRAETRAVFQGRSKEEVLQDVAAAMDVLQRAPRDSLGVAQLLGHTAEAPEAAARLGVAFSTAVRDRDGRTKVVLQGASPETIQAWMDTQKTKGVEVYGDPVRGFAGFYPDARSSPDLQV